MNNDPQETRGFQTRPSHLDIWAPDSMISKSGFKGFYNMAQLTCISFLICSQTIK